MRRRNADWHEKYTMPTLWEFYAPSRANHGSYYFDWTSYDEAAWRNFYRVWMDFLSDYKNMGGRVTVSSDAGYIYNTFGFANIEEMELLQEAGFHPLEVIRGATLHGAQALFEPKRKPIEFGVVRAGLLADLIIVPENPVANLKVLYGTGAVRLNEKTGISAIQHNLNSVFSRARRCKYNHCTSIVTCVYSNMGSTQICHDQINILRSGVSTSNK